ncbi:MAG TPA: hypothetical protein VHW04_10575 [Solirubrobacteraceae bacterium]|nr:hypothetical protein [Solirubrobacteraceae bacterium]
MKSVPGCFVLIVPRLIGDPVAAFPGVGPHDDTSAPPPLLLLEAAVDEPPAAVDEPPAAVD